MHRQDRLSLASGQLWTSDQASRGKLCDVLREEACFLTGSKYLADSYQGSIHTKRDTNARICVNLMNFKYHSDNFIVTITWHIVYVMSVNCYHIYKIIN